MNRTGTLGSVRVGDRLEVMTERTGAWLGGFEVASTSAFGCHVRRMSDGEVLPARLGAERQHIHAERLGESLLHVRKFYCFSYFQN